VETGKNPMFLSELGLGQTSHFSCAEPNVNEQSSLFEPFALGSAHEKFNVKRLT
jgi:hypothetical protein